MDIVFLDGNIEVSECIADIVEAQSYKEAGDMCMLTILERMRAQTGLEYKEAKLVDVYDVTVDFEVGG